jgi:hypothetical protein
MTLLCKKITLSKSKEVKMYAIWQNLLGQVVAQEGLMMNSNKGNRYVRL